MSERLNKTSICSIVFLDIVGYSQKPVSEQIETKDRFNQIISASIRDVAESDRIILDTGDGAAITLLGEPETALFTSLTIRDGILTDNESHPQFPLLVRIGINLGPVRLVSDINGRPNVIGDGINVAQRVMSFAEPNQILVSRSYYEIVSRLTNDMLKMFSYSGIKHDKHVREHEVYLIRAADATQAADQSILSAISGNTANEVPQPNRRIWMMAGAVVLVVAIALSLLLSGKRKNEAPPDAPALPVAAQQPMLQQSKEPQPEVKHPASAESKARPGKEQAKKPGDSKGDGKLPTKPGVVSKKSEAKVSDTLSPDGARQTQEKSKPALHTGNDKHPHADKKNEESNKSGLDKLKDSVKQGNETPFCSDAMRSLNQCK